MHAAQPPESQFDIDNQLLYKEGQKGQLKKEGQTVLRDVLITTRIKQGRKAGAGSCQMTRTTNGLMIYSALQQLGSFPVSALHRVTSLLFGNGEERLPYNLEDSQHSHTTYRTVHCEGGKTYRPDTGNRSHHTSRNHHRP